MEKKVKKLRLNKDVIAKLNDDNMANIGGGDDGKGTWWTSFVVETILATIAWDKRPCCLDISKGGTCAATACTPCSNYVSCGKCG